MKPIVLLFWGLLLGASGCLTHDDTHPDMPFLPQHDNAAIRVDSLANTTVNDFIFSADRTTVYAIVLTAATGVSAQHALVEFDQTGHRRRQLDLGEMAILQTDLALIQPNALLWRYANRFYLIDLQRFAVLDDVPIYSLGDYPDSPKDRAVVAQKSQAWLQAKQTQLGKQFGARKIDSVSLAILEGNKANTNAYQVAVREARSQQSQLKLDANKQHYEAYALKQLRVATYSFGYRSAEGFNQYLFTKFANGQTAAFILDSATIREQALRFVAPDVNTAAGVDRRLAQFSYATDQPVADKSGSLRVTEKLTTKYNTIMMNGLRNEFLFYYELKLGAQTAHFKSVLPIQLSDSFYLQSANESVYVLNAGTLYWFHQ